MRDDRAPRWPDPPMPERRSQGREACACASPGPQRVRRFSFRKSSTLRHCPMQATHSLEHRTTHCKAPPQVDWHHCWTYLQLSRQSACATVATMHSAPATTRRNRIAHPPSRALLRRARHGGIPSPLGRPAIIHLITASAATSSTSISSQAGCACPPLIGKAGGWRRHRSFHRRRPGRLQLADGSWVIGVEVQASPSDINKGVDWIGAYAPSRNDDGWMRSVQERWSSAGMPRQAQDADAWGEQVVPPRSRSRRSRRIEAISRPSAARLPCCPDRA